VEFANQRGVLKDCEYFIRLNQSSPKDKSCGPFLISQIKEIVDSLITSRRINLALNASLKLRKPDTLYFIPWRNDWNHNLEFRVFVHERKVVCISQYVTTKYTGWNKENIKPVSLKILEYCNNHIIPKFELNSFVVDVICVSQNNIPIIDSSTHFDVELVEFNPFGKELSSGSALFHWLNDSAMYGTGENVIVRYIQEAL